MYTQKYRFYCLVFLTEEHPELTSQTIKQKTTTYFSPLDFYPGRNKLETKASIVLNFRFYIFFILFLLTDFTNKH